MPAPSLPRGPCRPGLERYSKPRHAGFRAKESSGPGIGEVDISALHVMVRRGSWRLAARPARAPAPGLPGPAPRVPGMPRLAGGWPCACARGPRLFLYWMAHRPCKSTVDGTSTMLGTVVSAPGTVVSGPAGTLRCGRRAAPAGRLVPVTAAGHPGTLTRRPRGFRPGALPPVTKAPRGTCYRPCPRTACRIRIPESGAAILAGLPGRNEKS